MEALEDLETIFQWGKCANCGKTLTETTTVCVLIYPEEFCSHKCVDEWPTTREKKNGPHNTTR